MAEAYIIDACRTPRGIGRVGKGAITDIHPQQVASTVMKALVERNGVDSAQIDDIVWGTSTQVGKQGGDLARMAALDAGFDVRASAVTLDRFCGSGITAFSFAASQIMAGMDDLAIAGGVEMMSYSTGAPPPMPDAGNLRLRERHPQSQPGVAANAIATLEGISRADLDAFSLESQKRADHAIRSGHFDRALIPVYREDGTLALDREEYPRPQTTLEALAGLKASFEGLANMPIEPDSDVTFGSLIRRVYPDLKINHVHHAGSSSGVVDGAGALLLASGDYAAKHGLKPRARVVSMAVQGDCPTLMLNAPVPAVRKILDRSGLTVDDIDLWEINEAFAVVAEKFIRDLKLDRDKVNVNGGAIALGHPIGATGAILIGMMVDELERRDLKRGLITMCAAGGMAPAVIIERV